LDSRKKIDIKPIFQYVDAVFYIKVNWNEGHYTPKWSQRLYLISKKTIDKLKSLSLSIVLN